MNVVLSVALLIVLIIAPVFKGAKAVNAKAA